MSCVSLPRLGLFFANILLLIFTNAKNQISQLEKDSPKEKIMVSDLAILAKKWLKIVSILVFFKKSIFVSV